MLVWMKRPLVGLDIHCAGSPSVDLLQWVYPTDEDSLGLVDPGKKSQLNRLSSSDM